MKKTMMAAALAATALLLAYCKTAKKAVAAPDEAQFQKEMAVAEKRWPGVAVSDLKAGHEIYTTKCTACHKNFEITRFSEKKWLHEIDDMAPKASLTPQEKDRLTKHILSYREAFGSATQN